MSSFLIAAKSSISCGGVEYKADAAGVVEVPSEFDEQLINCHGLTLYVPEAPSADDAAEADALRAKLKEAGVSFGPNTKLPRLRELAAKLPEA